ncbi:hypothetical protein FDO65_05020 [Nakamurella flava]|uniref:Nuclear transport factor 2 family protein n=1 Tax=Nakamurella flava TaxID=2576308 RepID=A0A4U6QKK6_9ACTN|nr:hypothetical protein [Nakamurella flava]TKV61014.1 hypothetical protein FDO65_05020 [Nakamurella flava]
MPSIASSTPLSRSSSVLGTPSGTDSPGNLSPVEQADRAAIEAQWAKYWDVLAGLTKVPAEDREQLLEPVAVDPQKAKLLAAAAQFEAEGLGQYGEVILRPFWPQPIDGEQFALLRDCQDQSGWGSISVSTGEVHALGADRHFVQAGFERGSDGVWRVQNVQWIENLQC